MPRKKANIHYLYKTTCLVTGRYYIGIHSTTNLEDGYMGSGKRLRYSIRKYGKENHKKEILEFFDSRELLVEAEKTAITTDMLCDKMCMNIVDGGVGWNLKHNQAFRERLQSDKNFRLEFSQKISFARKREYQNGERKNDWQLNWLGRKHLTISKQKMSESSKGSGLGQENSQYGTCWITKDGKNKKIKQEELNNYLLSGWNKGRYSQLCGENVNHSKLSKEDVLDIKRMLAEGVKQKTIANKFMVAQETISKINCGLIWKSVQ